MSGYLDEDSSDEDVPKERRVYTEAEIMEAKEVIVSSKAIADDAFRAQDYETALKGCVYSFLLFSTSAFFTNTFLNRIFVLCSAILIVSMQ